jgi:hypothetical protein
VKTTKQYEAGDVLLCTKSGSTWYDVGSHYIVLRVEDGEVVLTDNINETLWNTYNFNDGDSIYKFEFVLSVHGYGDLNPED